MAVDLLTSILKASYMTVLVRIDLVSILRSLSWGTIMLAVLDVHLIGLLEVLLMVRKSHVLKGLLDLTTGLRHHKYRLRWLLIDLWS